MIKYLFANSDDVRARELPPGATEFTYHKKTAMPAMLAGLLVVALVEATVLHIIIAMWSHWLAALATLSTLWVGIQIIAQIRAVSLRPIYFADGSLSLRNGAFDVATIPIGLVAQVTASTRQPKKGESQAKPYHVGFPASHNVVLRIDAPMDAHVLNRSTRKFDTALLALDDPDEFVSFLQNQQSCLTLGEGVANSG